MAAIAGFKDVHFNEWGTTTAVVITAVFMTAAIVMMFLAIKVMVVDWVVFLLGDAIRTPQWILIWCKRILSWAMSRRQGNVIHVVASAWLLVECIVEEGGSNRVKSFADSCISDTSDFKAFCWKLCSNFEVNGTCDGSKGCEGEESFHLSFKL